MIALVDVLIEHRNPQLSRPFTYRYAGSKSLQKGMRVIIPFHQQTLIGFVMSIIEVNEDDPRLTPPGYTLEMIREVIDDQPIINTELMALAEALTAEQQTPLISFLQTMLPKSLKPSRSSLKAPKIAYEERYFINPMEALKDSLEPKEYELYVQLNVPLGVKKTSVKNKRIVQLLLQKQAIRIERVEKRRTRLSHLETLAKPVLTEQQNKIVKNILNEKNPISLLHGVTGSGKTEVYLALCEHYLTQGKSVLLLVPEIALTPVMMSYLLNRFGEEVALLHSELTPAEKYDEYRRILSHQARIVVGARSAIFAPLDHLGLIVLDEEHSETYKQDSSPSYHARDVAIWRTHYHHAKLILGSATPSLETKARAEKRVYGHFELPHRVNEKAPPKTVIIDLNQTELLLPEASMFTLPLHHAIQDVLSRKEQVILLVNRRGYSTSIMCRSCGYRFICPHCEIPLAYHDHAKLLKCHYCDYRAFQPKTCPECQSHQLMHQGFGVEKVEEHLHALYPDARVIRLDSDSNQIREKTLASLRQFQEGQADILLGTQMVAKGHDFPNVTLVGVLLADMGLNIPSYRATERTFQLLSQVVGRTGRGDKDGLAMIQTYHPQHYVIQTGSHQDYASFYREEMASRRATQYPPYTFLTLLEIEAQDEVLLTETMFQLVDYLHEKIPREDHLIGPNIPYPEKRGPFYRRRLLLKYKDKAAMTAVIKDVYTLLQSKRNLRFHLNLDPYDV